MRVNHAVASPKEIARSLGKLIYVTNLINIGQEMRALSWTQA